MKKRCVIYPKDVQRMTGRQERYCQKVISKIKRMFSKKKYQFVTIKEFSEFSGIPEEEILQYLD